MSSKLDTGEITLLDTFGDELTIVNSARVSFGSEVNEINEKDKKLIKYLWKNKHWSPFRHVMFRFKIIAPEVVMRQWWKHVVGIEWTSSSNIKDTAWNEISGRYKEVNDFYIPSVFRKQHKTSKQASDGPLSEDLQDEARSTYELALKTSQDCYKKLIEIGVSKEQARIILPLASFTESYWTCSFQALYNFVELRDHEHAQEEIRLFAIEIKKLVSSKFPILSEVVGWAN